MILFSLTCIDNEFSNVFFKKKHPWTLMNSFPSDCHLGWLSQAMRHALGLSPREREGTTGGGAAEDGEP